MTDAELQAEIDLEADRIRAFRDYEQGRYGGFEVPTLGERIIQSLAEHLVRNRAVPVYANTEALVKAAEAHIKAFHAYDTDINSYVKAQAHMQAENALLGTLEPFKEPR